MLRLRECRTEAEKHAAAAHAHAWGYPRTIPPAEVEASVWLWYGPELVFWFQRDEELDLDEVRVHMCSAPAARGRIYARPLLAAVDVVAQLLHHDPERIRVERTDLDPRIADYVRRLGWREDGRGWYKRLPGVTAHGEYEGPEPTEAAADHRQGG